jgi:hypothetical protein
VVTPRRMHRYILSPMPPATKASWRRRGNNGKRHLNGTIRLRDLCLYDSNEKAGIVNLISFEEAERRRI